MLTIMKERLQTILNLENLSAAQLSALLDIQRSTLSNLMSGRNNPSYDFIVAIMTKLPNLNVEWLLKGIGQPYKNPEKNFRGMSLNDAINTDKDPASILRQSNTNTNLNEKKSDMGIFDASEEPQYENGNLFGFPPENSPSSDTELPSGIDDFPAEDENTAYHPFPPLEQGELAKRLKLMQEADSKKIKEEIKPAEPSENPKFEENLPPTGQISPSEKGKRIEKVILLYSDGTFESFS